MKTPFKFYFFHAEFGFVDCDVNFSFDDEMDVWISGLLKDDPGEMFPFNEDFYVCEETEKSFILPSKAVGRNILFLSRKEVDLRDMFQSLEKAIKMKKKSIGLFGEEFEAKNVYELIGEGLDIYRPFQYRDKE